ncbi:hypothetical protein [Burkholderia ubonensis]|uniref:Uncharacterized protein n=1 Tax=Burkholderia ubonensis subsp. mesacidophila TaxID=265293 RepID=A0A2A4FBV0_9BURK|nr:hypothetical protein [Burkholderia ubonensis]PCE30074.1 hypothetical protein BZL54_23195 [Burkholderia ubonensis subsp. mesacidophila]
MIDGFKPLPSAIEIADESQSMDGIHPLSSVEGTEWHRVFDLLDPFIASRDELEELRSSAPNRRAQDWLTGIIDTRKMYAIVTGNPF